MVYKSATFFYYGLRERFQIMWRESFFMKDKTKEEVYAERQKNYKQEKEVIFREAREEALAKQVIDEEVKTKGKRVYTFRKG
jgi:hypothetical protein